MNKEITIIKTSAMGPTVANKMSGVACVKCGDVITRHWCENEDCSKCPYDRSGI